ncbi:hypothetical protein BH24ACI3_BH24ACI3_00360 [soil metagenome]
MKFSLVKARIFLFAFCLLLTTIGVSAQDLDNVGISGRVIDPNGLAVPGATVTALQVSTGQSRTVQTDDNGRYRMIGLQPGNYTVRYEAAGFGSKERVGLTTLSGQNLQLDMSLTPADVQAETTVTIDEDSPLIDITRTVVGGTIEAREIEDLPNNSRDALDLVLTLGGTSEESLSTSGLAEDRNVTSGTPPLEQGNFSLSGGTAYSNNLTIDGLDNNDDRSSRERFQPSLEDIAEVQVITNQFSAEYGRASGGRVNIRTRSGSNRYRGRAFMFFRDDSLNANTWYNNSRNFARQPLTEYNPGITFSGPVVLPSLYNGRNRTFFSFAYEYNDILDTTFIDTFVPTGSNPRYTLPTGNAPCPPEFPCVDANSTPPAAIQPYNVLYATPNTNHRFTAKFDHRFSKRNDITFGVQIGRRNNQRTTGASTTRLDDALQARKADSDAYNLTNNHVFTSKIVNQFRVQYSTFSPRFETDDPFAPVVLIGYRNPRTGGNQTLIAGNSTAQVFGDSTGFPQNRKETRWQIQESLTVISGSQTIKGGFDIHTVNSKATGLGDATGTYNFANIGLYQANTLSRYRHNYGTRADVENTYWSVFINDEWKAATNLTVNFGVRYERETAVSDNNNWGPRFGVAWSPFEKRNGVIRFGAGIFYNRVLLRTVADSIQNTGGNQVAFDTNFIGTSANDPRRGPILAAISNTFPNTYGSIADLRALVVATCATITTSFPCNQNTGFSTGNVSSGGNPLRTVEANLKIPESYQANVGFEREIGNGFVFEANYTWNKTIRLWRDSNPNVPVLPPGFDNWTDYLLANPFQLTSTRRYTFYLGSPTDTSGITTTMGGTTNCGVTTANCFVNLNTTNNSGVTPLVSVAGQNANATGGPIGIALAAISQFRPDPTVEETSLIGSQGKAFYQGLILEVRRRVRDLGYGFRASMRFAYTLSSTRDDGLNNTSNAEVNGDFGREWARNLQDRRHRIAFSGSFDTPYWLGRVRLSPLFRYGSSAPFNLGIGGADRNLDDLGTDRVNFSGNLNDIVWREPGTPIPSSLISQFSLQPIGSRSGNLPRNAGRGPSFYTFDLNIAREWRLGERMRLRPVVEFNNILNAAVFSFGSEFINFTGLTALNSNAQQTFLVPTRTYRPRQVRLGVRFDF